MEPVVGPTRPAWPWSENIHRPCRIERRAVPHGDAARVDRDARTREAGRHGVDVPLHRALYRLVKAKEESWS